MNRQIKLTLVVFEVFPQRIAQGIEFLLLLLLDFFLHRVGDLLMIGLT